jgi:hypothetical protein
MPDEYVVLPKKALMEFFGTLLPDTNVTAAANRIVAWVDAHDLSGIDMEQGLQGRTFSENDNDLFSNFDSLVWAERFVLRVSENPAIPTDVGTMLAWFAGAIMTGYDEHARKVGTLGHASYEDGWRDAMDQDNPPMSNPDSIGSIETAET